MFQSLYNYISVITEWWFNKPDHVFLPNVIAYCQQNRYVWLAIYTDWFTLRKLIYETLKNRCNFCASNTYWFLHIVDSKLEKVDYYHFNVHSKLTLREKYPYYEFFWSVFSCIRSEYGPEKLQIRKFFTQCHFYHNQVRTAQVSSTKEHFMRS